MHLYSLSKYVILWKITVLDFNDIHCDRVRSWVTISREHEIRIWTKYDISIWIKILRREISVKSVHWIGYGVPMKTFVVRCQFWAWNS